MNRFILIFILIVGLRKGFSQSNHLNKRIHENFSQQTSRFFKYGSSGALTDFGYKQGIHSTTEPKSKILLFKINPDERAGAGRGPEIISNQFTQFGTYSARLKVPNVKDVQPNVGAVVGYFTYHDDKTLGLSEIDFEWLIADPRIIYIGTWTGHHDSLQRIGRTINLATGEIMSTINKIGYGGKPNAFSGLQNQPETLSAIKDYDASSRFYTYGFDWYPDRMIWWILHPDTNQKIILWDYQGSMLGIPQHASHYRMNFWHTNNWAVESNPLSIEKPTGRYELEVDWMKYKPFRKLNKLVNH